MNNVRVDFRKYPGLEGIRVAKGCNNPLIITPSLDISHGSLPVAMAYL